MLPVLDEEKVRTRIAKRLALEFSDGDVVNLGIGIPTLVSDYVPENVHMIMQTENGVVGAGPVPEKKTTAISVRADVLSAYCPAVAAFLVK